MASELTCPIFSSTVLQTARNLARDGVFELVDIDSLPSHITRKNTRGEIAYAAVRGDKFSIDEIEKKIGRNITSDEMIIC